MASMSCASPTPFRSHPLTPYSRWDSACSAGHRLSVEAAFESASPPNANGAGRLRFCLRCQEPTCLISREPLHYSSSFTRRDIMAGKFFQSTDGSGVLLLAPGDNIAIATSELPAGTQRQIAGQTVEIKSAVDLGHKFAVRSIPAG